MEQQKVNDIKNFYFQTSENEYILPASTTKRFLARLLDLIIYTSISAIIMLIASQTVFNLNALSFQEAIPGGYNALFMCAAGATIITAIGLGIIFPLLNKKNPGQTLGKKALGITVIFFNKKENNVRDIILRELPIIGLLTITNLAILISGYNFINLSSFYNIFNLNKDNSFASISIWNFLKNSTSDAYLGAQGYQMVFGYIQVIVSYIYLFFLLAIFLSIAFNRKKVGLHDSLAKTSVVDLSTITDLKAEQTISENDFMPTNESDIIEFSNEANELKDKTQFPGVSIDDFANQPSVDSTSFGAEDNLQTNSPNDQQSVLDGELESDLEIKNSQE